MSLKRASIEKRKLQLGKGHYAVRLICKRGLGVTVKIKSKARGADQGFQVLGQRTRGGVVLSDDERIALVRVPEDETLLELEVDRNNASDRLKVGIDLQLLSSEQTKSRQETNDYLQHSLVHLSGHVELAGDVTKNPGEWLGKRSGAARVEGFAVHWENKPKSIELVYGCTIDGIGKAPNSVTGGFVGTRQRAAAIKALWIDLKGDDKEDYQLSYIASFSRSGPLVGRPGKITSGLGIQDHLVGLAVVVVKKQAK